MEPLTLLTFALFMALMNERLVEHIFKPLLERFGDLSWAMPYVALATGTLMSIGLGIDLITPMAESVGLAPAVWVGQVITAFVIGGGSNLLHDLWPGN